jgi:hypothetical protein
VSVEKCFEWERPEHGDSVRICQWRGIDNPIIMWDEERYGFRVGASFRTADGDFEFKELHFLSAVDLNEDRFANVEDSND